MEKAEKEKQQKQPMSMPPKPTGSDEPWFVFFHGKQKQYQTFYSISKDEYHVRSIPCLRGRFLCTCSYGWMVLIRTNSDECFLLNPTTMKQIQLPPITRNFVFRRCVLLSSPTDPSCTVMFISNLRTDVIKFRFCSLKNTSRWIEQEVKLENKCLVDATSCHGKIYGITNYAWEILIIEVVEDKTSTIIKVRKVETLERPPLILQGPTIRTMVVDYSCGDVYVVLKIYIKDYTPGEVQDIEVMKLDFTKQCWERVTSLGNRALFLGFNQYTSFCSSVDEESESRIVANTIYFTIGEDKSLYAYNLEDKSISVSLPCPNLQRDWCQPNWVVMLPSSSEEE